MMQKCTQLFFLFCLVANSAFAQSIFTKVTAGNIVNTPADSRSINWVDVNGDGWDDLFISTGPKAGQNNLLYLNNQDGTFTTVTNNPIVQDSSPADGATFADVDNDGDLDAFVVTWYGKPNFFYQNRGDGSFEYVPEALTANFGTYSETAAWGDYDGDGLVDLYITNSEGSKQNLLYRNLGKGNFERITNSPVVADASTSRCATWIDYDNDGDADLFVTNENNEPNHLFRNDGQGQFSKIQEGILAESKRSSMSASWGDVDNDGDFDVFIANAGYFKEQDNQLFLNNGDGTFTAVTSGSVITDGGCSYGSAFGDIDNDGDLDLAIANGFCNGAMKTFFYLNDGQGNFQRAEESYETPCSFGLAFSDYDQDGFLDLAIATCKNSDSSALPTNQLYHNNKNENNWLKIKLEGTKSNRAALGTKIRIKATINGKAIWQTREISAQSGYCGQNSLVAHFGIGDATKADSIIVEWANGTTQIIKNVLANRSIFLVESSGTGNTRQQSFSISNLQASPNPIKKQFQLKGLLTEAVDNLQLSLVNAGGAVVFAKQLKNLGKGEFSKKIKIGKQLPSGLHYLRLGTEERWTSIQVMIEN